MNYYRKVDHPNDAEKRTMWNAVSAGLKLKESSGSTIHWKSFWMGQAAAVIMIFAVIGAVELWPSLPVTGETTDLEQTYRNSLYDLASTSLSLHQPSAEEEQEVLESQLRGLKEVDRIIEEMRSDMLLNGSTQSKRRQLRRLYATKLQFIQQLILTEEVSS